VQRLGAATALLLVLAAGCLGATSPKAAPPQTETFDAIRFVTDAGPLTVLLYNHTAPQTVALLEHDVATGFYVGRSFGRVVPGHVIQVTDLTPNGATEGNLRVPLETSPRTHFAAGAAGIARGDDPGSGGPEFFLMDFATSHLDGNYTVWGQTVEGLDTIHRIARGPSIDLAHTLPAEAGAAEPTDRMATPPVTIRSATIVQVTEPAGRYPLGVAKDVRAGDFRHSLEWPADLQAGQPADLTWYVRPYNATPPPDASAVRIEVAGMPLVAVGEPDTAGVYHVRWTPPHAGAFEARFDAGGKTRATLQVAVPAAAVAAMP